MAMTSLTVFLFITFTAVTLALDDCLLAPDIGTCDGYFLRYYYDAEQGKCEAFMYGGCEGNNNRFESRIECEKACTTVAKE
ncbi:kappaPI-actitoxin-Avd3c [Anabrus simplex]|uniref:kappaPI-actitoxin-Avd3c n=1 Tax=Anabrus simplex TaxID=316456 RepID=UPI0035A2C675